MSACWEKGDRHLFKPLFSIPAIALFAQIAKTAGVGWR
jgi:hypothetical protein